MERIWHYTFYTELAVNPKDYPVFMIEAVLSPKAQREKITQVMFETFDSPALFLFVEAVAAVHSSGKPSGIVLSSGESFTYTVAVVESFLLPHTLQRLEIGGRDLTDFFMKTMCELGYSFTTTAERERLKTVKEQVCYVALDFEAEMKEAEISDKDKVVILDVASVMHLKTQIFRCPEVLFSPGWIGNDSVGVHQMLFQTIMSADFDVRDDLFQNILLEGGSTRFEGFLTRLYKELRLLAPPSAMIKILSNDQDLIWKGSTKLANSMEIKKMLIRKEEYVKIGPPIIHRKC